VVPDLALANDNPPLFRRLVCNEDTSISFDSETKFPYIKSETRLHHCKARCIE